MCWCFDRSGCAVDGTGVANSGFVRRPTGVCPIRCRDRSGDGRSAVRCLEHGALDDELANHKHGRQQCDRTPASSRGVFGAQDRIDQRDQLRDVMAIGFGQDDSEWDAVAVDDEMVFRAWFPAIRGVRAGFSPPPTAQMVALSTDTREKSMPSTASSFSSINPCSRCYTPARCHLCKRFQSVMPQQPISCGKSSQGMPVLRTNRMPVKQTRSGMRGLPPFGLGVCFGSSGSTSAQSSPVTNNLAITPSSMTNNRIKPVTLHRTAIQKLMRFF